MQKNFTKFSNSILVIIFKKFRETDEVDEVMKLTKEEVKENFWDLVKESGLDDAYVLGKGLKAPEELADKIIESIPKDMLEMIKTNPTGKDYCEEIKNLLVDVIKTSVRNSM